MAFTVGECEICEFEQNEIGPEGMYFVYARHGIVPAHPCICAAAAVTMFISEQQGEALVLNNLLHKLGCGVMHGPVAGVQRALSRALHNREVCTGICCHLLSSSMVD